MKTFTNLTGKDITTMQVGGPINLVLVPETQDELINILQNQEEPFLILGNGSNIIIKEEGYSGVIIINKIKDIQLDSEEENLIWVSSGTMMCDFAYFCYENGLTGAEFLNEIPGTIGGGIYMNVSAWGEGIDKIFRKALILIEGKIRMADRDFFNFEYRKSSLHNNKKIYILSVAFELKKANKYNIKNKMDRFSLMRESSQPLLKDFPSSGTIFKNVNGLIQKNGLSGLKIGGAEISKKNCGFIINNGNASAFDVIALINIIKDKTKGELEVEIF